jgi:hypothetical protein
VAKQKENFFMLSPEDLKYVEDHKDELKKQWKQNERGNIMNQTKTSIFHALNT